MLEADTGDAAAMAWPDADPRPRSATASSPSPGPRVARSTPPAARWPPSASDCAAPAAASATRASSTPPRCRAALAAARCSTRTARLLGFTSARLDGGFLLAQPATIALRRHLDDLAEGRAGAVRTLGVAIAHPRAARRLRRAVGLPERDGLLLQDVADASAAATAGLESGDLLVAAGDAPLTSVDALLAAIDATGGDLALRVVRGADERDVLVRWE